MLAVKKWGSIAVAVTLAAAFTVGTFFLPLDKIVGSIREFASRHPMSGSATVILLYALSAVLLVPGSALTVLCGTTFGLVNGTAIVVAGSNLGALCAFMLSKTLFSDKVRGWVDKSANFRNLYSALAANEWKITFLTRLSPLFPYTLLNYFMGVSPVRLSSYATASILGMLPGTFLYVYIGAIAGDLTQASQAETARLAFYVVGLIATIIVVAIVSRTAKKAILNAAQPSVSDAAPRTTTTSAGAQNTTTQ